jgi:hypothetical protein
MTGSLKKWRGSGKATKLLISLFGVVLLAMSFVNTVSASGNWQERYKGSLRGEVVSVNTVNHITTLTLRSEEIGNFPNDTMNIFLNRDTKVKSCNASEPARDINVGRNATIQYHVSGGVIVADALSERC